MHISICSRIANSYKNVNYEGCSKVFITCEQKVGKLWHLQRFQSRDLSLRPLSFGFGNIVGKSRSLMNDLNSSQAMPM